MKILKNMIIKPQLSEKERQILSYLSSNGKSKAVDIAKSLIFSISTTKKLLYRLVESKLVDSIGEIKSKKYFLM